LERAHAVNARYHVLGGTLSPLDGIGPQDLTIDALVSRAHDPAVKEVILALTPRSTARPPRTTSPTCCTTPM
jgi:recombination protein RecR